MLEVKLNAIRTHQMDDELKDVPQHLKSKAQDALDAAYVFLEQAKATLKNPRRLSGNVDSKSAKAALVTAEKKDKALTTAAAAILKVLTHQVYPRQHILTYT